MIVRRQRVTLVVIQAIAVGSYARHKYVALEIIPASARRRLHLDSGSAAFPVVNVIVDHVELPAGQRAFQSLGVVAVGHDAGHFLPQIVPGPSPWSGSPGRRTASRWSRPATLSSTFGRNCHRCRWSTPEACRAHTAAKLPSSSP